MKNTNQNKSKEKDTLSSIDLSIGDEHILQGITTCLCTYCGDNTASDRDHIIPASWLGRRDYRDEWVLSCKDCNLRLGDSLCFTVEERAEFVLNSIMKSKKCRKLLSVPKWSESEINELDYSLRRKTRSSIRESENLKERVRHLQDVADVYLLAMEVTDERTARAIIHDLAHTRGRRKYLISQLSVKYSVSECKVDEILTSVDYVKFWIALKCMYGFDYSITNNKLRMAISK